MKKYDVYVDVSETWDDGDIEVLNICVEAKDAEGAYNVAHDLIMNKTRGCK